MNLRRKTALITAFAMLMGTQTMMISAAETDITPEENAAEVTVTTENEETENEKTQESEDSESVSPDTENEKDSVTPEVTEGGLSSGEEYSETWKAPAGFIDEENQKINDYKILGSVDIKGKSYYQVEGGIYFSKNDLAVISLSESTAKPGGMTYIDISFKGDVQLNIFLSLLDYDRSSLKLVSASFEKDLSESDSGELSPDSDFSATEAGVISYFEDGIKNIDMSGDHTIRLGFEVNEEAAEGEYKIGLSNMDTGSLTGLSKIDKDEEGNFMIVYVPVNYISGSVKVSNTETPKTGLKAKPLRRAYASVEGVDLSITGDVNEDGSINAMDIVKVKQYFVGSEEKVKNADANEDGVVNIADILTLAENIAG